MHRLTRTVGRSLRFAPRGSISRLNTPLTSIRHFSVPPVQKDDHDRNEGNDADKKGGMLRGLITWKSVLLLTVVGAGAWVWFDSRKREQMDKIKEVKAVGTASIGGPFSLVDHNGRPTTDSDYRGSFMLLYFGFTHCPDICPAELQKMAGIMNRLEKVGFHKLVQPVFITIDPWRDSVSQVRDYVKEFHPSIIGLTGSPGAVTKVCKAYRVYVSKSGVVNEAKEKEDEDYLVDHSIILYLMGPDGKFIEFYSKTVDEEQAAEKIIGQIRKAIAIGEGGAQGDESTSLWGRIATVLSPKTDKA
eukprot:TRINITY_DN8063_c0_g1_i1.p1 TRINITY_DN8063_c0_g1~~TRINITY_DN8063_c0_g1_i1.p1  ORF type:complete len:302 (+),score=63.48 TRINITY_DN8063_c0_g1_i1:2-907(+)